jgi:DNA adenine methylase
MAQLIWEEYDARSKQAVLAPKPVLKWAGGKQQMIEALLRAVPSHYTRYIEPFFGGGALFFALRPKEAIIADANPELINLYRVIAADVEALIELLGAMRNDEETFYASRATDPEALSPLEQAARTIYLNRTCFNGLYRVNHKGEFNVPYGRYKTITICDAPNLRAVSRALQGVEIVDGDYKDVLHRYAQPGDLIYLDPPYLPISVYSDFKRYTKEQFYEEDHRALAAEVHRLHALGCFVLLTNSNHPLVHELYASYQIEVHQTRRNINKDASKRTGEDVLVIASPNHRPMTARPSAETPEQLVLFDLSSAPQQIAPPPPITLPPQVLRYPSTRFMGSKQNLLADIWAVASRFEFHSVLDLFSGSGVVSYLFKAQGKQVFTNDYMVFSALLAKALIENSRDRLSEADVQALCDTTTPADGFVSLTFKGLYYADEDNAFIDTVRANLSRLESETKRALALAALVRACLKKRPRGIFAYVGQRYDDGRRDLQLSLKEQFLEAVEQINAAVFDNGQQNAVRHGDALESSQRADLVYIDPPYYSPLSDNEYVRRYHFVEGLARNWEGVEIQWHTKTRKFKSYPSPFNTRQGAYDALSALFQRHSNSILLISYSSHSQPTQEEILKLLKQYKRQVDVISVDHRYSFGNQGHKVGNTNNQVQEYLFVGF